MMRGERNRLRDLLLRPPGQSVRNAQPIPARTAIPASQPREPILLRLLQVESRQTDSPGVARSLLLLLLLLMLLSLLERAGVAVGVGEQIQGHAAAVGEGQVHALVGGVPEMVVVVGCGGLEAGGAGVGCGFIGGAVEGLLGV